MHLLALLALSACGTKQDGPDTGPSATEADDHIGTDTNAEADVDADADADTDVDADADCDCASYEGMANFKGGFSTDPSAIDCDLYWANSGTPTDLCDGCEWAFAVDFIYDAGSSYDGVDCFGGGDTDWTWGLGYFPDYYGSYGAIYYDYYGTWYPTWLGYFDGSYVQWGGGYYQYPYYYNGADYYYTRQWQGGAYVE